MRLQLLHIENIAVIEKADIEFTPGLNVLTGETGAGKSIVIDALTAVTGGRVSRDIVRHGATNAAVTAVFYGDEENPWLEENGIEPDGEDLLILMRKITAEGKSTCRVNGIPVSTAQLRELGGRILDIHGQNDGRKLLDEAAHLTYLDFFGGLEKQVAEYRISYKNMRAKIEEIKEMTMDEDEKEQRLHTLKLQAEEIERANVKPGELSELVARRDMLQNASKLTEAVEGAFEAMYGGERTGGAVGQISEAASFLQRAERYSENIETLGSRLVDLQYAAQDIAEELRDVRASLDFSPEELDALETRISVLRVLTKRYGGETEALEHLVKVRTELSDVEDSAFKLEKLNGELDQLKKETKSLAESLTEKRTAAGSKLEKKIMLELADLSMPGVAFKSAFEPSRGEDGLGANGADDVRFLMSANAGETPGRISRIASGGELSRIMLALKNVLSGDNDTGTAVFDEVDAGVSGVAAQRVGEKLSALAERRQILCVTHLPQIAAMADTHFEISKSVKSGRTFTKVSELDFEGRKSELARLIGGENITMTTLISAAEQLEAAEKYKKMRL